MTISSAGSSSSSSFAVVNDHQPCLPSSLHKKSIKHQYTLYVWWNWNYNCSFASSSSATADADADVKDDDDGCDDVDTERMTTMHSSLEIVFPQAILSPCQGDALKAYQWMKFKSAARF